MKLGIREIMFVLLLLAMPVASYVFVFQPRNEQINEAYADIKKKQAKLQQLEQATRSISDLGAEIDRLTETIDVFEQKLPAEREVEVVLKEVWKLAAENRLNPKSIQTDKPTAREHYAELPLRMQIVGDFDGFYNFLLQVEKLSRITRMPKMKLRKLPNEVDGQMEADVILSIYYESRQAGGLLNASGGAL